PGGAQRTQQHDSPSLLKVPPGLDRTRVRRGRQGAFPLSSDRRASAFKLSTLTGQFYPAMRNIERARLNRSQNLSTLSSWSTVSVAMSTVPSDAPTAKTAPARK